MRGTKLALLFFAVLGFGIPAMPEPEKKRRWKTTDSPAYLTQAPVGIPGDITRTDETNVEPAKFAEAYCPAVFGFPVVSVSGEMRKWPSGAVAVDFQGVLVREVPAIGGTAASDTSFAGGVPWFEQVLGVAVRGYVAVKCSVGTPARNGVVYVQSVANGGINPGEFRADGTDSGNAVALTAAQAVWASDGLDSDKNAELRIAR